MCQGPGQVQKLDRWTALQSAVGYGLVNRQLQWRMKVPGV